MKHVYALVIVDRPDRPVRDWRWTRYRCMLSSLSTPMSARQGELGGQDECGVGRAVSGHCRHELGGHCRHELGGHCRHDASWEVRT